jgi:hypothetical protein
MPRQCDSELEETRQVPRFGVDGALGDRAPELRTALHTLERFAAQPR